MNIKWISLLLALVLVQISCSRGTGKYSFIEGETQGTTYHITYCHDQDFKREVDSLLQAFDLSLSLWVENSVISRVNRNEKAVRADEPFREMFEKAMEVSRLSGGAFDITVGPLVNAYGFGFKNREDIRKGLIDSLLQFVGYQKVRLEGDQVVKDDPRICLDANALAQGQATDMVFRYLSEKGITNLMVEIGGEVRCAGLNPKGQPWRIGVDKPIENSTEQDRSLQSILQLSNKALSTSGNYRKFYEKDGVKYSHTIDPHTGYPVNHNLLSATVVADDCISADAFSTTLMVLGPEKSKAFLAGLPGVEAYLIFAQPNGSYGEWYTNGLKDLIHKAE